MKHCIMACAIFSILFSGNSVAEEPVLDGAEGRPLSLEHFQPRSMLVLPENRPQRARFPVVDVHTHMRYKLRQVPQQLDEFVRLMDHHRIAVCVCLDGQMGESFVEHRDFLWKKHHDRFVIFANIDWRGDGQKGDPATWSCHCPGFAERTAQALAAVKDEGASGLKIYKSLGLKYRNPDGSLVVVDDPRWDPIWEACGELGLPVLIHTADPVAFFKPVDRFNERWEELRRRPEWSFAGEEFPSHAELLAAFLRVVERHPQTTFIAAHVANYPENLEEVGRWLNTYPNLLVDISARIAELGRQPRTARSFFLQFSDRILFGTDGPRAANRLIPHWRMLETDDEYFPYAENQIPPQGLWNIYGLGLPDEILHKIYHENAVEWIPGVAERIDRVSAGL